MIKHSVILLKRDHKRFRNVKNNIQKDIPNLNIFNAFDYKKESIDFFCLENGIKISDRYTSMNAKTGGIANVISHIKLWKKMIKYNIPEMVVLEDDGKINSGHFVNLNNLKKDLPIDYNLCLIYVGERQYRNDNEVQINRKYINKGYKNYGMICYLISLSGAKHMLEEFKTIKQLIDVQINQLVKNTKNIHKIFSAKYPFVSKKNLPSNVLNTEKYK